jgi:hypothetical protein
MKSPALLVQAAGRFFYATAARLLALKFILSMSVSMQLEGASDLWLGDQQRRATPPPPPAPSDSSCVSSSSNTPPMCIRCFTQPDVWAGSGVVQHARDSNLPCLVHTCLYWHNLHTDSMCTPWIYLMGLFTLCVASCVSLHDCCCRLLLMCWLWLAWRLTCLAFRRER